MNVLVVALIEPMALAAAAVRSGFDSDEEHAPVAIRSVSPKAIRNARRRERPVRENLVSGMFFPLFAGSGAA